MSEIQDMTTQMAKELMLGIQDSVEDLAASFQKMAILHDGEPACHASEPIEEKPVAYLVPRTDTEEPITEWSDTKKKQTRKKKVDTDENQLSLFDLVA